mmetsp:Transcript_34223/g.38951  ORF Transcript_34223/g.38951 Transcript_34223/m.38951 type:complete len:385 (+) Transcript_34223:56-1210(+)
MIGSVNVFLLLWLCIVEESKGLVTPSLTQASRSFPSYFLPLNAARGNSDNDDGDIRKNTRVRPSIDEKVEKEAESSQPFVANYTGIPIEIEWKQAQRPIPIGREIELLNSGVLLKRGEFGFAVDERCEEIEGKCHKLGMTREQGFLIRKHLAVTKVIKKSRSLEYKFDSIKNAFCTKRHSLLQLSYQLDLPPVSIFRAILKERIYRAYPYMLSSDRKKIVQKIIQDGGTIDESDMVREHLTNWETDQLRIAKENDVVGYEYSDGRVLSSQWEEKIYDFLKERKVNFLTEDDLRVAGLGGVATPDCLLLDECIINGRLVRWIDAKNFYGSGLTETNGIIKKMKKQIAKYQQIFGGDGAIVFKHGFSVRMIDTFPSTLFLDAGQLW